MKIISVRRISQIFFFLLFIWFCLVTTLGDRWWQLRGWPVNWLIQLDPLVGLGTLLATHSLFRGLMWGLVTVVLTLILGRVFCGWICPFGALQQFMGYLGGRNLKTGRRIQRNQPHPAQGIKYGLLILLLAAASADLVRFFLEAAYANPFLGGAGVLGAVAFFSLAVFGGYHRISWRGVGAAVLLFIALVLVQGRLPRGDWLATALQTGLLDPIPLMQRSVNLVLLPLVDNPLAVFSNAPRFYQGAGLIGILFLALVLISLRIPRFYCRFICPTGALLGLLSRWSLWRIGKKEERCQNCRQCEAHCEGACTPTGVISTHECVVCLNCLSDCRHDLMQYSTFTLVTGSRTRPDLTRRHVMVAAVSGLAAAPMMRLAGFTGANWNPRVIRPPGALNEARFLQRCIKCGQCMRLCPTQVIQPALLQAGVEGLWTPVLDFRMGSSGCQPNCVACSQICPTAAIRPLTIAERMGRDSYQNAGPLRIGTAFVDRGRCLPWAMDTPCIVCQENCPVSPKAIFTREVFRPLRNSRFKVGGVDGRSIVLETDSLVPGQWSGGDYFCQWNQSGFVRISDNTTDAIVIEQEAAGKTLPGIGGFISITIRLQQPYVDPRVCIGCGMCEHECPVHGRRAIRVSAENESRNPGHQFLLSFRNP